MQNPTAEITNKGKIMEKLKIVLNKQILEKNKMIIFKTALYFASIGLFIFLPLEYKLIYSFIFCISILPFFLYVNFNSDLYNGKYLTVISILIIFSLILSRSLQNSIFPSIIGTITITMFFIPEIFIFLYNFLYRNFLEKHKDKINNAKNNFLNLFKPFKNFLNKIDEKYIESNKNNKVLYFLFSFIKFTIMFIVIFVLYKIIFYKLILNI